MSWNSSTMIERKRWRVRSRISSSPRSRSRARELEILEVERRLARFASSYSAANAVEQLLRERVGRAPRAPPALPATAASRASTNVAERGPRAFSSSGRAAARAGSAARRSSAPGRRRAGARSRAPRRGTAPPAQRPARRPARLAGSSTRSRPAERAWRTRRRASAAARRAVVASRRSGRARPPRRSARAPRERLAPAPPGLRRVEHAEPGSTPAASGWAASSRLQKPWIVDTQAPSISSAARGRPRSSRRSRILSRSSPAARRCT